MGTVLADHPTVFRLHVGGLLALLLLALPGAATAQRHSPACTWVGSTLGLKDQEWWDIIAQGRAEAAIRAHCFTRYCGRKPRMHHSMVYEIMPCDPGCFLKKRALFRQSCVY
ncbi:MAG: hypothetical protein HQL82_02330 [Magnetococcales bacterium]|nr:hypothetical protein [Magnetococcales bacterium]